MPESSVKWIGIDPWQAEDGWARAVGGSRRSMCRVLAHKMPEVAWNLLDDLLGQANAVARDASRVGSSATEGAYG